MKRSQLGIIVAAGVAVVIAGVWYYRSHTAAAPDAAEGAGADAPSALVATAMVKQETLPLSVNVFGEVATGKVEAVSFPQAGQLVQLAVVAGQPLRRGDLIATLTSDPNAQTAYAQALTARDFAQRELQRNRDLLGLQLATQAQVDTAAKQLQDAQTALAAQAQLGGAQALARLVAPFDAVVTTTPVAQGDRVQAGATIVQLGHTDVLRAQLALEPAQSTLVKAGMPVTLSAVQDSTRTVTASITEVQNLVDPKTQMVTAVVALPAGKQAHLLSGMRVQGAIQLGQRAAWSVPRQAVLTDDKGAYLFQVQGGKAARVDVSKLVETGQTFGVDGKLDAKLPVVTLGNYELQDGMAVREAAK